MDLISVIVPVYNMEKYLPKCIDSLVNQTYPNLEIILIDDGSTDNSGRICDDYAEKHKNIVVVHTNNQGQWHARNVGLDICEGDYIGFVDSDDYVDYDMFEVLYVNAIEFDAEISGCYAHHITERKEEILESCTNRKKIFINISDFIFDVFTNREINISIWNKLYKRQVVENVRFSKLFTAEDVSVVIPICKNAKKIIVQESRKYYYNIRSENTTNKITNSTSIINLNKTYDQIEAYRINLENIQCYFPELVNLGYSLYWNSIENVIRLFYPLKNNLFANEKIKTSQAQLKCDIFKILHNNNVSIKGKIAYCLLCFDSSLYIIVKKIQNILKSV